MPRRQLLFATLAVMLLAAGLYARTYSFDYTYLDDDLLIANDAAYLTVPGNLLRAFGRTFFDPQTTGEKYYRPIVTASFVLNACISERSLTSFHLMNVALHALVCGLLVMLLVRLGYGVVVSVALAALFAVHPVLSGAVAWVPGRVYLWLALFTVGALLCLLRWSETRGVGWLVAHAVLLAGALLSQEAAVMLPVALVAWLYLEPGGKRLLRQAHLWLVWGAVLAGWFVVWRAVVGASGTQKAVGGYLSALVSNSPALLVYLGKVFYPRQLSVLPVMEDSNWIPGAVVLVVLALLAAWLRGPARRRFLWGVGWFLGSVAPSLPVSDFVFLESRLYVPMIGLLVAAAVVVQRLCQLPVLAGRPGLAIGATVAAVLVAGCGIQSWRISASYRDRDAFSAQAVTSSPHAALAHQSRGHVLYLRGDLERAAQHFAEAVRLEPTIPVVRGNLGATLLSLGRLDAAQRALEGELSVNPGNDQAHYNLALLYRRRGRADRALMHFRLATEFNPQNVNAWGELLSSYARRGKWAEAERCRRQMERLGVTFVQRPAGR